MKYQLTLFMISICLLSFVNMNVTKDVFNGPHGSVGLPSTPIKNQHKTSSPKISATSNKPTNAGKGASIGGPPPTHTNPNKPVISKPAKIQGSSPITNKPREHVSNIQFPHNGSTLQTNAKKSNKSPPLKQNPTISCNFYKTSTTCLIHKKDCNWVNSSCVNK